MAISIDSIYRPFREFFVSKFDEGANAPIAFRFARLPRTFLDTDFVLPRSPEPGPSEALALEVFSDVMDDIARLHADGSTLSVDPASFSELYHDEILSPAIPARELQGSLDENEQARVDAFNAAKADAKQLWDGIRKASLSDGAQPLFRPTVPRPARWWDTSDAALWTSATIEVSGAATPAADSPPVLRLKLDDAATRVLLTTKFPRVLQPPTPVVSGAAASTLKVAAPLRVAVAQPMPRAPQGPLAGSRVRTLDARKLDVLLASQNVLDRRDLLPYRDRFVVDAAVASAAPEKPVTTSAVSIAFDYCIVMATRAWLHEAFLRNNAWCIPGLAKGALSANDGHGQTALPVGFLAIKQLRIRAAWTPEDLSNLGQSIQFGPFGIEPSGDGVVGHDGIQVIGWLLQDLPDLPPNDGT